ncbi:hypothetical protein N7488_008994 [Penicillium malachiteum]|nr:hypothetical protein N7488_008994 [Penicillium malachiteum]
MICIALWGLAGGSICRIYGLKDRIVPLALSRFVTLAHGGSSVSFYVNTSATTETGEYKTHILETSQGSHAIPYYPYPDYNSAEWKKRWKGTYQQCLGPNGTILGRHNEDFLMKGYQWDRSKFPVPIFGSYKAWDLDDSLCTDRFSQYAAYGYSNEDNELWDDLNWGTMQQECVERNAGRYRHPNPVDRITTLHHSHDSQVNHSNSSKASQDTSQSNYHARMAVILRTWIDKEYTPNDILFIRSMVMELSLHSGGEYEVFLLVDSKDVELPELGDESGMEEFKKSHLPEEIQDIAVFFNEKMLADWYPKIDVHVAILQYFQPVQIFSRLNPQYDYIWQFEMDSRYTGHLYHLLEQAGEFAKQQPRKHLWERNSYFYIPAVHGDWDKFVDTVDQSMGDREDVWGPSPAKGINVKNEAPAVPRPDEQDSLWTWGIGEEADVITWMPQFDPKNTNWPFRDRIFNFKQGTRTPVRSSPVAMSRVSARLLRLMHADKSRAGYGLASEMSPVSWALFYGLKSVQVPMPVYHELKWDPVELNRRANPGEPGSVNAVWNSIWSWKMHDDIMLKLSYMFSSEFPGKLYRAWLGLDDTVEWEKNHRRLCLPPMLIHPVKNTE